MINAIKYRRSHRDFLDQRINEEKIKEMLDSALASPSANGKYPWELILIKDPSNKKLLAKTTPWSTFAENADFIIAIIGDEKESPYWIEDCSIVAEHLWLEATEQNLGACWIQIRNQRQAEETVKEILNIPDHLRVLCLLAVGLPANKLPEHQVKDFDRKKIKYEKYK